MNFLFKGILLALIYSIFSAFTIHAESLRVVYIIQEPSEFKILNEEIINMIDEHFANYSAVKITFIKETKGPDFFEEDNAKNSTLFKDLLKSFNANKIMYLRWQNDKEVLFKIWDQNAGLKQKSLEYNKNLKSYLPDIAVHAFLEMLYNIDDDLWRQKVF